MSIFTIIRYGCSGLLGALVNLSIFHLFLGLEFPYLLAAFGSFVCSFIVSFLLQKHWTFADHSYNFIKHQGGLYFLSVVVSLALNLIGLFVLVDIYNWPARWAQVLVVIIVGLASFLFNRAVTFKTILQ